MVSDYTTPAPTPPPQPPQPPPQPHQYLQQHQHHMSAAPPAYHRNWTTTTTATAGAQAQAQAFNPPEGPRWDQEPSKRSRSPSQSQPPHASHASHDHDDVSVRDGQLLQSLRLNSQLNQPTQPTHGSGRTTDGRWAAGPNQDNPPPHHQANPNPSLTLGGRYSPTDRSHSLETQDGKRLRLDTADAANPNITLGAANPSLTLGGMQRGSSLPWPLPSRPTAQRGNNTSTSTSTSTHNVGQLSGAVEGWGAGAVEGGTPVPAAAGVGLHWPGQHMTGDDGGADVQWRGGPSASTLAIEPLYTGGQQDLIVVDEATEPNQAHPAATHEDTALAAAQEWRPAVKLRIKASQQTPSNPPGIGNPHASTTDLMCIEGPCDPRDPRDPHEQQQQLHLQQQHSMVTGGPTNMTRVVSSSYTTSDGTGGTWGTGGPAASHASHGSVLGSSGMLQQASSTVPTFKLTSAEVANTCAFCKANTTSGCWRRGWELPATPGLPQRFANLCNKCGLRHKHGRLGVPPYSKLPKLSGSTPALNALGAPGAAPPTAPPATNNFPGAATACAPGHQQSFTAAPSPAPPRATMPGLAITCDGATMLDAARDSPGAGSGNSSPDASGKGPGSGNSTPAAFALPIPGSGDSSPDAYAYGAAHRLLAPAAHAPASHWESGPAHPHEPHGSNGDAGMHGMQCAGADGSAGLGAHAQAYWQSGMAAPDQRANLYPGGAMALTWSNSATDGNEGSRLLLSGAAPHPDATPNRGVFMGAQQQQQQQQQHQHQRRMTAPNRTVSMAMAAAALLAFKSGAPGDVPDAHMMHAAKPHVSHAPESKVPMMAPSQQPQPRAQSPGGNPHHGAPLHRVEHTNTASSRAAMAGGAAGAAGLAGAAAEEARLAAEPGAAGAAAPAGAGHQQWAASSGPQQAASAPAGPQRQDQQASAGPPPVPNPRVQPPWGWTRQQLVSWLNSISCQVIEGKLDEQQMDGTALVVLAAMAPDMPALHSLMAQEFPGIPLGARLRLTAGIMHFKSSLPPSRTLAAFT